MPRRHQRPGVNCFRRSIPRQYAPLSTLHVPPRDRPRMTRGQCGSLLLHCNGLAPSTSCRSPGAPWLAHPRQLLCTLRGRRYPRLTQHSLPGGQLRPNQDRSFTCWIAPAYLAPSEIAASGSIDLALLDLGMHGLWPGRSAISNGTPFIPISGVPFVMGRGERCAAQTLQAQRAWRRR
jgi:hypothetical protein